MDGLGRRIGKRIRTLRVEQGLTIEGLGAASGLPPESVGRIERGGSTPSLATLNRLAKGLAVTLPDLLGSERSPPVRDDRFSPAVRQIAALLEGESDETVATAGKLVRVLVRHERSKVTRSRRGRT
jgi:transcriptional regulator with XRE-family HTH domain